MTRAPVPPQTPALRSCRRVSLPLSGERGNLSRLHHPGRAVLWSFALCAMPAPFTGAARAADAREYPPPVHAGLRQDMNRARDAATDPASARTVTARLFPIRLAEAGKQAGAANAASGAAIGVVYPDLGEPYRSVFATIVDGIQDKARMPIRSYPVGPNAEQGTLESQVRHDGVKVVIALGRQGLKAASTLGGAMPVVVGGVLAVPAMEKPIMLSISLTPDPALLFAQLKSLVPGVRRVLVVYNPH